MSDARISLPFVTDAALPMLAVSALRRDDRVAAFFAADRWIRLAGENASSLLLRAEAAHRLGFANYAVADLVAGLSHEPRCPRLNHRLAEWGHGTRRASVAQLMATASLLEVPRGLERLAAAGEFGAGAVRYEDGRAIGWCAWKAGRGAELQCLGVAKTIVALSPDPGHAYARFFGAAVDFCVPVPARPLFRIALAVDGRIIVATRVNSDLTEDAERPIGPSDATLTVLVPVYGDPIATRDCLNSVAADIATTPGAEALVVDDASRDPKIKALLDRFAKHSRCRVQKNASNLGFVGAVNRGLRSIAEGDVLLLNADTRLPPGGLARLRAAARAHPDVGILNPLSNHGEFVSYPRPFRRNAFEVKEWLAIDRAAATSNEGRVIDIPSGTGFCMYVTRACLEAVGLLSAAYLDGYLEDADFGLRARDAGFRNVCVPSVYVPHLGSRSFKSDKTALVARNRYALARRFPTYDVECRAFLAADPLREARARVESRLAGRSRPRRIVIGPSHWAPALRERAAQIEAEGVRVLMAFIEPHASGSRLVLRGADDSAPQNQNVGPTRDGTVIAAALKSWPFDRIELFWTSDGAPIPLDALDPELRPLDIVLSSSAPASPAWPAHDKVIAFDALAERSCARMGLEAERPARRSRSRGIGKPRRSFDLAFVYPYETPESLRFLLALAPALRARGGAALVLGATSGDERLSSDRVFATGPVEREEASRLLDVYRAPRFASPYRGEGFWALESVRVASPAPIAYFDWTRSEFRLRLGDLALDPDLADSVAAELLLDWAFAPVTTPVASRKRAHA